VTHINKQFLHNSVDNVALLHIVTTMNLLKFFHDGYNKVRHFLIFIETDLYFLWLTTIDSSSLYSSCRASNCRLASINCLSLLLLGLLHLILLLLIIFNSFIVSLFIDLFLKLLKLDIIFLDIDITVSQETADFTDIKRLDGIIAMSPSHRLRETNE